MRKKTRSMLIALLLLMTYAVGIPLAAGTAEGATEPLYVVTVLREGIDAKASNETEFGKYIEETFGIVFDYVSYNGDWAEKCALMLASGDYPEFMQINTAELMTNYIDAGALLSFDDYQALLPNFYDWYAEAIPSARASAKDGKLYYYIAEVGGIAGVYDTGLEWSIRSDLLEEQGWPSLLTASEWIEFFKTAKANHPTTESGLETFVTLPLGESWGMNTLFKNTPEFRIWNHVLSVSFADEAHPVYDTWADGSSNYDFLAFWNEMWRENLLDPECFTDKCDQLTAKANTTQALATWYARWLIDSSNRAFEEAGTPQYIYVEMPFRTDANADAPRILTHTTTLSLGFGNMCITKNAKEPERLMKLLDYLCSDEGMLRHHWGEEGVDYTVDPETGLRDATPALVELYKSDYEAYKNKGFGIFINLGVALEQKYNPRDMQPGAITYSTGIQQVAYLDRQLEAIKNTTGDDLPWDVWGGPNSRLQEAFVVDDESWTSGMEINSDNDLYDLFIEIEEYTWSAIPKVIMAESAEEFAAAYAETVATRKAMGIDRIVACAQAQVDAALAGD